MTILRALTAPARRLASWLLRPPDYKPCEWANVTAGEEET